MTQSGVPHTYTAKKSAQQRAASRTCREERGAEQANTAGKREGVILHRSRRKGGPEWGGGLLAG